MPSLLDQQIAFGRVLDGGPCIALLDQLAGPAPRNRARLAAYRRNVVGNGRMALASTFPVLRTLLGDRFTALADDYLAAQPSRSADLNRLGESMVSFVATHPLCLELPYLKAMARLEWALQETYDAPQDRPVDFGRLADLPPAQQAAVVLLPWPGASEFDTDQPVLAIWEAHQVSDPVARDRLLSNIVPPAQGVRLKTTRSPSGDCGVVALTTGEQVLLAACRDGLPLLQGLVMAAEQDPEFDGNAVLANFNQRGWVAGFNIPEGAENESAV